MKLEDLRQRLMINNQVTPKKIVIKDEKNATKQTTELNQQMTHFKTTNGFEADNKKLKLIGITGSKGKTTVANILHHYLKKAGYKSVLYASNGIDSPASFNIVGEAIENPLPNEQILLNAIDEAIAYDADFLILEVNERSIHKGLTKDIPFDIRVITNVAKTHNNIFYPNYVEIKKTFFKEAKIEDNVTCIFSENDGDMFQDIFQSTQCNKVTYMSNYVALKKNINPNKVNYRLSSDGTLDSMNGLDFSITNKNGKFNFKSSMIMPYNAINIMGAMSIIDTLNVFDYDLFKDLILSINVQGRDEIIKSNGRTIVITTGLSPQLSKLKQYRDNKEIHKLIVVSGAPGFGYKNWEYDFDEEKVIYEREKGIEYAYTYIKNHADKVYITENDNGTIDLDSLMSYQASFLKNEIPYIIEPNRTEAIKKSIIDSEVGDVIFIAGRGNRKMMCIGLEEEKIHSDKEETIKILHELGWRV